MENKGEDEDSSRLEEDKCSDSGSENEVELDVGDEDGDAESGQETEGGSESGGSESAEDGFSSDTSNGDSEKCPICLQTFVNQEIGVPDNCEHNFCLKCIAQWARKVTTCPIDRKSFNSIMVKNELNGEIKDVVDVISRDLSSVDWDEQDLDPTYCEVCGHSDREDRLLLCDGCDLGFHLECLEPALDVVPIEDWYCPRCQSSRNTNEPQQSTSAAVASTSSRQSSLRVPRTSLSRRIMQQRRMTSSSCSTPMKSTPQSRVRRTSRKKANTKSRKPRRKYKTKGGNSFTKSKRRRKKRRVKKTNNTAAKNHKRCRVAQQMKPSTAKGRLAQSLGLILPRPGQPLIGLPSYRPTNLSPRAACSRIPQRRKRYQDGIAPSLNLFGSQYDLSECLETVSDEDGSVGVTRIQPILRIGLPRKPSLSTRLREIEPLHLSSSSNVLGPILNSQQELHVRDVRNYFKSVLSSSSEKLFSIPLLSSNKEVGNDSSGYDSALRNNEFPTGMPQPNFNRSIPFLTATGGNSSSSVRPTASNNSDSHSTSTTVCPNNSTSHSGGTSNGGGEPVPCSAYNSSNLQPSQSSPGDTEGLGYVQFLYPLLEVVNQLPKEDDKKNKENQDSKAVADDGDDYNIYSDIEEEPREDASADANTSEELVFTQEPKLPLRETEIDKMMDHDSDSDMVIDEEQVAGIIGSQDRESRSSVESLSQLTQGIVLPKPAQSETECVSVPITQTQIPPDASNCINFDSDSQESIPLPDSTPPPSIVSISEELADRSTQLVKGAGVVPVKKDEYDPSQPLTSSDEEEQDIIVLPPTKFNANPAKTPPVRVTSNIGISPTLRLVPKGEVSSSANVTSKHGNTPTTILKTTISKENTKSGKSQLPSDEENENDVDLSSIPMPSDEYRRPTIQFSIPTRHRLIPISSLIKRQKGVIRKETKFGVAQSFHSEISKAFGSEKGDEENDEDMEAVTVKVDTESGSEQESPEKVSLVAEIFGTDDEDDEDEVNVNRLANPDSNIPSALPLPGTATSVHILNEQVQTQTVGIEPPTTTVSDDTGSCTEERWKIVENKVIASVPPAMPVEPIDSTDDVPILKENDDVAEVNCKKRDDKIKNEGTRVRLSSDSKVSGSFLESISDEEGEFENSKSKRGGSKQKSKIVNEVALQKKEVIFLTSANKIISEKEPEKTVEKKLHKRRRSQSSNVRNNFEEGEIAESPDKKKRKARKTKKSKHRRRSRDLGSDSLSSKDNYSDKQGQEHGPHTSSSDEDGMGGIPWKKPSKSTKERNYRDGKPKTEENFFREKEKKRDTNAHADRRKKITDNPDLASAISTSTQKVKSKEREKAEKDRLHTSDSKRGHRRSISKSKSPLPWRSISRSLSKSRTAREKKRSKSSSPSKSLGSRSPSAHTHSRRWKRRRRHSVSQRRGFRSRSRSRSPPRARSRSANKRNRVRRKSRSLSSRERKLKGRRRSISSSSGSDEKSKARKKGSTEDKTPKKVRKDKEKEKTTKEKSTAQDQLQSKEKEKDKDKKRKKRKREKSASPAKEIFTDGDSIVVSLNFQKGKDGSTTVSNTSIGKDTISSTGKNDSDQTDQRKRRGKHMRKSSEREGMAKPLKKTILIDLGSSPIQEQNIGVSPTLIVLSDDEETLDSTKSTKTGRGKDVGNDRDGVAVSTTTIAGLEGNIVSPSYRHSGHGVPADSTQLQPHPSDTQAHTSNALNFLQATVSADDGSSSPTRGDSLVTSTRDSVEIPLPHEEDTRSPSSPQPPEPRPSSPLTPPLPPGTPPPESVKAIDNSSHKDARLVSPNTPPAITTGQNLPLNLPPPPGISIGMNTRPLGIGNIPGLFPSGMALTNSNLGGISSMLTPIVIPTPPPPQIRFNPAVLNANVIASVANALYAPLLAAKQLQQQQTMGRFPSMQINNSGGVSGLNRGPAQGTVLLPKNQNSHSSNNRRGGGEGGDSPFSPNSSEGDDLFEPPIEKTQSPKEERQTTLSSGYGGMNQEKVGVSANSNSSLGPGHGGPLIGKAKNSKLFDTLFGGPPNVKKSNQVQAGLHSSKLSHTDKLFKPKLPLHKPKPKSKPQKKEIVKLSEGELRLSEDVPTSAVELRVKEKFLKKLNRQERVVEEVKLSLKPHYSKKHVDKDEYKEILRRAVPKICHNKSGEINPFKIKELIEAYVKKFRKNRKP